MFPGTTHKLLHIFQHILSEYHIIQIFLESHVEEWGVLYTEFLAVDLFAFATTRRVERNLHEAVCRKMQIK